MARTVRKRSVVVKCCTGEGGRRFREKGFVSLRIYFVLVLCFFKCMFFAPLPSLVLKRARMEVGERCVGSTGLPIVVLDCATELEGEVSLGSAREVIDVDISESDCERVVGIDSKENVDVEERVSLLEDVMVGNAGERRKGELREDWKERKRFDLKGKEMWRLFLGGREGRLQTEAKKSRQ